ncbi:MAG TPA: hypothetical protein VHY09_14960 [Candidatus Methylacidiphilales bacterium]|jgi:hypothetical protein|nr:hypothetical protein [Candidatus Methylacidiphilales bacterium]
MKNFTLALVALVFALPARADDAGNWIENGDFTDGINHWYGGGRSPADYANDNPLAANDPLTSKGLIMPLHSETWTKVAQDFKGKAASGVLSITYKLSPDFAFSTKPEDYQNVPSKIGYDHWRAFNIPPGQWMVYISDFGSDHGLYWMIPAKTGGEQTLHMKIQGLTPYADKTITLAFPPGNGMFIVLNVTMADTP